jgi:hypothetical protein
MLQKLARGYEIAEVRAKTNRLPSKLGDFHLGGAPTAHEVLPDKVMIRLDNPRKFPPQGVDSTRHGRTVFAFGECRGYRQKAFGNPRQFVIRKSLILSPREGLGRRLETSSFSNVLHPAFFARQSHLRSLQLRILRLSLLEDSDVGIGVFPGGRKSW